MRTGLLATASSVAIILATTAANAYAPSVTQPGGTGLRGAYDVADKDAAPQSALPKKANHLAVTAASAPMAVETQSAYLMTAKTIATSVYSWNGAATGNGVVIGIVDTGLDLDHPEFKGRVLPGNCFKGYSAICSVTGGMIGGDPGIFPDQRTHGTHVAGIAAGETVGIAKGAKILPVKVCDTYGSSCPGDPNGAMIWASLNGAKVINLSLGGPGIYSSDIAAAAKTIANGALLVVAAGNRGNDKPVSGYLGGAALKPGVRGGMIVVGATGLENKIAPFSQVPGSTCETYSGVKYCMRDYFVVAPGVGIKSSVGGGSYGKMSGTSMATPYVTGVAALIKGQWSTLTPYQVASIIFRTTKDLGAPGADDVYGRGAVDVAAAMAPVGGDTVIATTSGTTTTTARGKKKALSSASVGVFSASLQKSSVLKNVVLIDEYGRDFNADLTKVAQAQGMSLSGMLRDPFRNIMPLAMDEAGAFGAVSMSGFVEQTDAPEALNANAALQGMALNTTEHVAVSFSPMEGVSLDFGRNIAMSGSINSYDFRANSGESSVLLSGSALNSPYLSLADGGNYSGATVSPLEGVKLRFGYASVGQKQGPVQMLGDRDPFDPANTTSASPKRQASSVVASLAWDFSDWGGLGVTASQTKEQNSVLGGYAAGAFEVANNAGTSSVGVSARMSLGNNWTTTLAWNEGTTNLGLAQGGLFSNVDSLKSRAYGVGFAKHGLFGDDTLGFALTRPLHIYSGGATVRAATSVDANQNLVFSTERLSLASPVPETDFEIGYATNLLGGAIMLQGSAAYQMDVAGQQGKNAVTALGRASFRF